MRWLGGTSGGEQTTFSEMRCFGKRLGSENCVPPNPSPVTDVSAGEKVRSGQKESQGHIRGRGWGDGALSGAEETAATAPPPLLPRQGRLNRLAPRLIGRGEQHTSQRWFGALSKAPFGGGGWFGVYHQGEPSARSSQRARNNG